MRPPAALRPACGEGAPRACAPCLQHCGSCSEAARVWHLPETRGPGGRGRRAGAGARHCPLQPRPLLELAAPSVRLLTWPCPGGPHRAAQAAPFSPRCGDVRRPVRVTRAGQGQMAHPECGRAAGGRPDEASPQPVRPAPAGRVPGARARSVRQTSGRGRVAAGFSETRVLSPPRSRHAAARAGPPRLAQPEWLCHTSRAQRACGGNSPRGARDVSLLLPQKLTWEGRPAFAAPASLASGTDGARAAAW